MQEQARLKGAARPRGSRHWTEQHARELLSEQAASGLSVERFANLHGLVAKRLYWWRQRLAGGEQASQAFLPVVVRNESSARACAPVVIAVADGVRIEVNEVDARTAAWVRAVLGSRGEP